jgi:hypothetical protein
MNEMGGECSRYGENTGTYRDLVGITEEKRPLGRPRRRWKNMLRWIFRKLDVRVGLD